MSHKARKRKQARRKAGTTNPKTSTTDAMTTTKKSRTTDAKPADDADQGELRFGEEAPDASAPPGTDAPPDGTAGADAPSGEDAAPGDAGDGEEGMMVPVSLLRKAEAERDQYLDLAKRTKAEFENYRRRREREAADWKRQSLGAFLASFLAAFDDLDRTIAEGEQKHEYETFHEGVKIARRNLWRAIEEAGVKPIDAEGRPFDPNVHEAIHALPSREHEPGTVIEVFQNGFTLDDFVLRPARVVVAQDPGGEDGA
jgi:molecular chaperone GrpE